MIDTTRSPSYRVLTSAVCSVPSTEPGLVSTPDALSHSKPKPATPATFPLNPMVSTTVCFKAPFEYFERTRQLHEYGRIALCSRPGMSGICA